MNQHTQRDLIHTAAASHTHRQRLKDPVSAAQRAVEQARIQARCNRVLHQWDTLRVNLRELRLARLVLWMELHPHEFDLPRYMRNEARLRSLIAPDIGAQIDAFRQMTGA